MTSRVRKTQEPETAALVALIHDAMNAAGMSRGQLSEATGIADGTLANMFAGYGTVKAENLLAFIEVLGLDARQCFEVMRAARQSE